MHEQLERIYAAGDHQTTRALAQDVVRAGGTTCEPERADVTMEAQEPVATREPCVVRARAILIETTPDFFLTGIGVAGLGLVAWLVYNYVL